MLDLEVRRGCVLLPTTLKLQFRPPANQTFTKDTIPEILQPSSDCSRLETCSQTWSWHLARGNPQPRPSSWFLSSHSPLGFLAHCHVHAEPIPCAGIMVSLQPRLPTTHCAFYPRPLAHSCHTSSSPLSSCCYIQVCIFIPPLGQAETAGID